MEIKIHTPEFLNDKGRRENNEDCIYPFPEKATENDTVFVVCDGVGGLNKGEIASRLACESFAHYYENNPQKNISEEYVLQTFDYTQKQFDNYFEKSPHSKGMATTLCLVLKKVYS